MVDGRISGAGRLGDVQQFEKFYKWVLGIWDKGCKRAGGGAKSGGNAGRTAERFYRALAELPSLYTAMGGRRCKLASQPLPRQEITRGFPRKWGTFSSNS